MGTQAAGPELSGDWLQPVERPQIEEDKGQHSAMSPEEGVLWLTNCKL